MNPLFCSIFGCPQTPLGDFLGALDDEEFFVVEGSGGDGVAGSLLPGDLPPTSLSDSLQR